MYKNPKSTIDITLTIMIVFIRFSIDYVYGSSLYPCFPKKGRSSSLLFTRERQKRAEASAASCAVDVSAPGGSCSQEYIDVCNRSDSI
jgi:hypothetical protein